MAIGAAILNGLYGSVGAYFGIFGPGQYGVGMHAIPPSATKVVLFHEHGDKNWIAIYAEKGTRFVTVYDGIGEGGSFGPARSRRLREWQATLAAKLQGVPWFAGDLEVLDGGIYTSDNADESGCCSLWWAEFRALGWQIAPSPTATIDAGYRWFPTAQSSDYHASPDSSSDITWDEITMCRFKAVAGTGHICMIGKAHSHES